MNVTHEIFLKPNISSRWFLLVFPIFWYYLLSQYLISSRFVDTRVISSTRKLESNGKENADQDGMRLEASPEAKKKPGCCK